MNSEMKFEPNQLAKNGLIALPQLFNNLQKVQENVENENIIFFLKCKRVYHKLRESLGCR